MRTRVLPIYFVNYDNRTSVIFQRLAQDKFSLSLRPIVRVHHQEYTVHHFHDPLHLSAEIGVAWRVHNVYVVVLVSEGGVFRLDGNPFFALKIHRVHHALFHLLISAKSAGLPKQLINQGRLAMVNVRDDRDVTSLLHIPSESREDDFGDRWRQ